MNPNPSTDPRTAASAAEPASIKPYTAPKPEKVRYALDASDWIFAAILLCCTLFSVVAGLWGGFQAGFSVSFLALFAAYTVYLARGGAKPGAFAWVCGTLAAGLSAVFWITSDMLVRFCAVCLMMILSVIWFASLADKPVFPGEMGLAVRVLRQVQMLLARMPRSVSALFSSKDPRVKKGMKALLGLLCAFPVLCVVAALLVRSDAAFEGLMQRMFADVGVTIAQILVTLAVFPFLLSLGFSTRKDADRKPLQFARKGLDTLFIGAFLGLLSVCYLVYLGSQLAYFFSAFSGILPADYTFSYAEYARRGFFELCGIAGINLSLLYLMLLLAKKTQGKLPVPLRILGTFIDLFTLLLICTAMAKMILYIRQYGVTVNRVGTSAFMLFMAVVFLALLLRFYLVRVRVLPVALAAASLVVLVLGIGNLHAFAAWYNYTAYENGTLRTVDTAYLRHLGDEGVGYLVRLTECGNQVIRDEACGQLCIAVEERYNGEYESVWSKTFGEEYSYFVPHEKTAGNLSQFSIPRRQAYTQLDAFLQDHPDFLRTHAAERAAALDGEISFF